MRNELEKYYLTDIKHKRDYRLKNDLREIENEIKVIDRKINMQQSPLFGDEYKVKELTKQKTTLISIYKKIQKELLKRNAEIEKIRAKYRSHNNISLEYAICESERYGDINLDTRNELLGILYEKSEQRIMDEVDNLKSEFDNDEMIEKTANKMLDDLVSYLKSYAKKNITKDAYPYSYNIVKIEKKHYNDFGSVQICEPQAGIQSSKFNKWMDEHEDEFSSEDKAMKQNPYGTPKWYKELLKEGKKYLNVKYRKEIKEYGFDINTGDGDECNIYINPKERR